MVAVAVKLEAKETNNVQTLLKKQQEVTDELKNYISAINAPPSNLSPRRRRQGRTAMNQLEKIRDRHLLHTFLQDCEELHGKTEASSLPV